jgi:hypothetical protein
VPLTFIVVFTLLALLPTIAWPIDKSSPFPYPPYLPFPVPEFLLSIALWSLSYLLRDPLFVFSAFLSSALPTAIPILLSTALHTFLSLLLQQSSIPLLLISHYMSTDHPTSSDPAFRRVWWIALGWAAAEAVVGIQQGYEAITLYRDVLVSVRRPPHLGLGYNDNGSPPRKSQSQQNNDFRLPLIRSPTDTSPRQSPVAGNSAIDLLNRGFEDEVYGQPTERLDSDGVGDERQLLLPRQIGIGHQEEEELQMQLERDVDKLVTLKNREELEEVYGMPVIVRGFSSCCAVMQSLMKPSEHPSIHLLSAARQRNPALARYLPPHLLRLHPLHPRPTIPFLVISKNKHASKNNATPRVPSPVRPCGAAYVARAAPNRRAYGRVCGVAGVPRLVLCGIGDVGGSVVVGVMGSRAVRSRTTFYLRLT